MELFQEQLNKLKIKQLNEMQKAVFHSIETENKIVLLSPTGSGKTLAFLLPLMSAIINRPNIIQGLIIAPSRELVLQIESVIKQLQPAYKITVCYGGHKREIEENNLVQPPAIIIGTPGRLGDHIRRKNIDLSNIEFLIVDEFDKCLELGFTDEMKFIYESLPKTIAKRLLTSATNMETLPDFVDMNDAKRLDFLPEVAQKTEALSVKTVLSDDKDKLQTLLRLLCFVKNTSSIVFCNHRESVERVSEFLKDQKMVNVFYHGGMEQMERESALAKFRNTSSDVLVTTDLASRGLDIADIRNIIHYHLPNDEAAFTHRNGRTARMNATGNVYVIYSDDEKLPSFVTDVAEPTDVPREMPLPDKPKWTTLFIAAGKKNKINKMDIVGFLSKKGDLKSDDIGLIEVKDFTSFVAVRKTKVPFLLEQIKDEKMKNQKVKFTVAK